MNISEKSIDLAIRMVANCLESASPGNAFLGRAVTTPIEGQGMMAMLAATGDVDPRALGHQLVRREAHTLSAAIVITDATLTAPDGTQHDAAIIDIFERGEPTGYTLAQFYRHSDSGGAAGAQGKPKLMGTCPQLIV